MNCLYCNKKNIRLTTQPRREECRSCFTLNEHSCIAPFEHCEICVALTGYCSCCDENFYDQGKAILLPKQPDQPASWCTYKYNNTFKYNSVVSDTGKKPLKDINTAQRTYHQLKSSKADRHTQKKYHQPYNMGMRGHKEVCNDVEGRQSTPRQPLSNSAGTDKLEKYMKIDLLDNGRDHFEPGP